MWKLLKSLDNKYEINENAVLRNSKSLYVIKPYRGSDGYHHVRLNTKGRVYRKRVHRLMAEAFLNNCSVVRHLNLDKTDNCLSNLRKSTIAENNRLAYNEPRLSSKPKEVVADYGSYKEVFPSLRACERATGIDRHRISQCIKGLRVEVSGIIFKCTDYVTKAEKPCTARDKHSLEKLGSIE
jgi:hypothetical protein